MSTRSSWKKWFSKKSSISFFRTITENCLEVWQLFFGCFAKTGFNNCRGEFWWKKKISNQKNLFPSISDFELLIFRLVAEKIGIVFKAAFYVSGGNFCSKTVSERKKTFFIFGFSAVKYRIFFWRSGMVVKLPVEISRRTSGGNEIWRKKDNSNQFSIFREKVSNFCKTIFSRAVKSAFYLRRAGIPGKSFFKNLSFTDFPRFWAELFGL